MSSLREKLTESFLILLSEFIILLYPSRSVLLCGFLFVMPVFRFSPQTLFSLIVFFFIPQCIYVGSQKPILLLTKKVYSAFRCANMHLTCCFGCFSFVYHFSSCCRTAHREPVSKSCEEWHWFSMIDKKQRPISTPALPHHFISVVNGSGNVCVSRSHYWQLEKWFDMVSCILVSQKLLSLI